MRNNSNTAKNTNISDKSGYYLDDNDCIICSYYRGKKGYERDNGTRNTPRPNPTSLPTSGL
jgi:hypothetical protein